MVLLESPGGRVVEAAQIADMVKERGLRTRVAFECSSACTLVFLNGAKRDLAPSAQLGFHRVATGASNAWIDEVANAAMAPAYLGAGLPQNFIDRINATDNRSIWYPTRDELISAGVIRQASAGLELDLSSIRVASVEEFQDALLANPLWMAVEQRFPASISTAAAGMLLASQSGLSDEAVAGEAMKVLGSLVGKVLRTASSETLERFTVLHAREVGKQPERQMLACNHSTALGALGPGGAAWLLHALQEPERDDQTRLPSTPELEVIHRELGDVSLPAVGRSFYESSISRDARASCVRLSRMIERISWLPTRQRRLAARLMLQA